MWIPLTEFSRKVNTDIEDSPVIELIEELQKREGAELLYLVTSLRKPRLVTASFTEYNELSPEIYVSYKNAQFSLAYSPAPLPKYKQKREISAICKTQNINEALKYFDLLMVRLQYEL